MIDKGFSIDNNAYKAAAKVIAATTNVPLDRMLLKIENVQAALSEEADWWQSMAMLLGWPKWMIMPDATIPSHSCVTLRCFHKNGVRHEI